MPIKRRVPKRREPIDADHESWLHGEAAICEFFDTEDQLAALWREHEQRIVAEWIEEWPGTRPDRWWEYSAPRGPDGKARRPHGYPQLRRRIGGIGTLKSDVLAHGETSWCGMPTGWITQDEVLLYTGRNIGFDGRPTFPKYIGRTFEGVPIDPRDPPRFESQATYLRRHGLLLPGEAARLTAADFEPETVKADARG